MESALEELVTTYKTELGLSDKEADQLQHLQVGQSSSNTNPELLLGARAAILVPNSAHCPFCFQES